MKRLVIDIEGNDLLANMLDFSSLPYKLKPEAKLWCIVVRDVDTDETTVLTSETGNTITKEQVAKAFEGVTEVIAHNGIKFDFIALDLFGVLDYEVGYLNKPDYLFGKEVKITDTLIRSRLFNPDRYGGHSLDSWGKRVGNFKDDFRQQSIDAGLIAHNAPKGAEFKQFSQIMVDYCKQDTLVTKLVHIELEKVYKSWDKWAKPEKLENKLADLAIRRESYGFWFDKALAVECLEDLQQKMQDLADKVNPILPPKPMNKGTLKEFTPPKLQFKKDGTPSAAILKFAEKHGAKVESNTFFYQDFPYKLPLTEPIETHEKATIDDLDHVKMHLISLGWKPTEFKVRDLTKDAKKQSIPYEKRVAAMDKWLDQTFDEGKYKESRLHELDMGDSKAVIRHKLLKQLSEDKPVRVPTSPAVRVGVEKDLCPSLVALGDKVSFAEDFTLYLTYKHRKSSIAGGDIDDMDFDDEYPNTGFLSMYREVDGRVSTPAIEIGASTNRYRHIGVCNIARASSIYGKQMRSLFGCGSGMVQLGFDFSSLEARIQGHYILPFNGEDLSEQLLASKPNDIHCYSEDTEILTPNGWKTFGILEKGEKVAQYEGGNITFVEPLDVVWQPYEGLMYEDPTTKFKVTPNHRVLYKQFKSGVEHIVRADEFKGSSDKRYIVGGKKQGSSLKLSKELIQLIVATQADGHFARDCSAITFTFVKQRKIDSLKQILESLKFEYSMYTLNRKGRDETTIRIKASDAHLLRDYLKEDKSFKDVLLNLSYEDLTALLNEVKYWDGTTRENGDVVFDTTSKSACEFIQTVCALVGKKANYSEYSKTTGFGVCAIYRCYISNNTKPVKSANKPLEVSHYEGFIGCVSVPSGLVLVKRKGEIVVSGNTLNAKKLGIARDQAKSVSYALMYGASYKKLKKMLGLTEEQAKTLFEAYWEAVAPLKHLKEAVTQSWNSRGKSFVIGVDGRKIVTRSAHSLLNALFQSGGVICAKYSTVFIYQLLEEQGYKCNPFKEKTIDMCGMIEYHDECQLAVNPSLIKYKVFKTEDEANEFINTWQGEQLGSIAEGKGGTFVIALPNPVSQAITKAIDMAVEEVNLKVPLGCEWVVHRNWMGCH